MDAKALRRRFIWMLTICKDHGWIHLAELVQQQLDALPKE
jgi:hypothetical protein